MGSKSDGASHGSLMISHPYLLDGARPGTGRRTAIALVRVAPGVVLPFDSRAVAPWDYCQLVSQLASTVLDKGCETIEGLAANSTVPIGL